ncbi:MAG: amidohydrolase [Oscillospiraceae bacterium]|jgi:aminobenzoyl-glutamate utilization protein B
MQKSDIWNEIDRLAEMLGEVSDRLWREPELSSEEERSSALFKDILKKNGFIIKSIDGMPTAFIAEFGSGSPVIALLAEYDALPSLSQQVCAEEIPVEEGAPGHGCGHNLLGTALLGAALAGKKLLSETGFSGTIRLYGCPSEELLSGKVIMARKGAFKGCDLALTWHPGSENFSTNGGFLAMDSIKFHFSGKAAHAAAAPQAGRSALDAAELMNVGANYLREHIPDRARIHYSLTGDRYPPNIVPASASVWYYVRAPKRPEVEDITKRLIKVAQGAALMTETEVSIEKVTGCYELNINPVLCRLTEENLIKAPKPEYTQEELEFAAELQNTVGKRPKLMRRDVIPSDSIDITELTGSTDCGDVSYIMPMQFFNAACFPDGLALHTWQSCAAAGSALGKKGMIFAAKVLSGIVFDLVAEPELWREAAEEFKASTPPYVSPLEA